MLFCRPNDARGIGKFRNFLLFALALLLAQCTLDMDKPTLKLRAYDVRDLPGWEADDLHEVVPALMATCASLLQKSDDRSLGLAGYVSDWKPICTMAEDLGSDPEQVRHFFQSYFYVYQALDNDEDNGLFTGYFVPELRGSLTRGGVYQYPLYTLPQDLILIDDLGKFRETMKGERLAGRLKGNKFLPYDDRATIDQKGLDGKSNVLVWVDSDVDAFFLHIQGSGRVALENGDILRVGYDGHNGHIYYPIGRHLIDIGAVEKDKMSMQAIVKWLADNPDVAKDLMHKNPSYIFFKKLDQRGIVGGAGVPLTAGRSLAIDKRFIPYGVPLWLDITHPEQEDQKLQSLVMAQDTGGAIRGPVRGDLFWGAGLDAARQAGSMKSTGGYYIFLPKTVVVPENIAYV